MAKPPKTLKIRIPAYVHPRNSWRRKVNRAVIDRQRSSAVTYGEKDKLEVELTLYFTGVQLSFHDVDNRLKDVLDALQGRAGGAENMRTLQPLIPNDNQIYRVVVQKKLAPLQRRGEGTLLYGG